MKNLTISDVDGFCNHRTNNAFLISLDQGCLTFCSSRAKFLSLCLLRAAIVETIKVMLSCELVQKFPSPKDVFSKKKSSH